MNIRVDAERSASVVFKEFFAERASRVYTGYVVFFSGFYGVLLFLAYTYS